MPAKIIPLTTDQREAVTATGGSLLVSAAAGSGKTTVIAERCAYLACDAPAEERCDVDSLLVVTFTEAAATQMRSQIVEAIRRRADAHPRDARLREQLALVDAAQICTIDSFCLWLIRRGFNEIDVDPTATVVDAAEAVLLKKDVLDGLLTQLYASWTSTDEPPAADADWFNDWRLGQRSMADLALSFVRMVDQYGLGEDRNIRAFVLRLHDFLTSLPEPREWLTESVDRLVRHPERVVAELAESLVVELQRQREHVTAIASRLLRGPSVGHFYASKIRDYAQHLERWTQAFSDRSELGLEALLALFERIRREIDDYGFPPDRAPPLRNADPETQASRDEAAKCLQHARKRLYERARDRFARFPVEEIISGLREAAPFVATIVDIVDRFSAQYARAKKKLSGLDFADLGCFALRLLQDPKDPAKPSPFARTLHHRFAHVLVDEFQDINPIQHSILRLVSRECEPSLPGNLFTVGDVKQSVYRFRLAEPSLFAERQSRFGQGQEGKLVVLQANFRSRPTILSAVNLVFRQLMRSGLGDTVYDEQAELRLGRKDVEPTVRRPVELHLFERRWAPGDEAADEAGDDTPADAERGRTYTADPRQWSPEEREAFWLGSRIREWMQNNETVEGRPLQYRDIAVLLRVTKVTGERFASVLNAMGIPAYAEAGGSLFTSTEIRDVLAALEVLDNVQQDIPLASVLRSGVFGDSLTEDELVEIRCFDRPIPFHAAVRAYAEGGTNAALRRRVGALLACIARYREDIRVRPLAEVLSRLYERGGYLAYALGMPNGAQRQANLLKFYELARQFGSFRRQGLHRFLRFIGSLADEEEDVAVAPSIGESDDVVRILSIHQSKGLQFPVVFVAGLGTRFNLRDTRGRMLFERRSYIGLRTIDTQRMVEYPTAAHRLVVDEIERTSREEEMRILYVAMTRVRERLVLVGSMRNAFITAVRHAGAHAVEPSLWQIANSASPLDWLLPALSHAPTETVHWNGACGGGASAAQTVFEVFTHGETEMSQWQLHETSDASQRMMRQAVANLDPLPVGEPLSPDDPEVERLLNRLEYIYPHAAATAVRATIAASELNSMFDDWRDPEQRPAVSQDFVIAPTKYAQASDGGALRRGIVTHRVLQHLDFTVSGGELWLASEVARLVAAGIITADEASLIELPALAWFVSTPLAERIRALGPNYRRELRFLATEPVCLLDPRVDSAPDDRVLVRGMVDGILVGESGLEVVDFKTDAIERQQLAQRIDHYRPQVCLYAKAVGQLWRRPVPTSWLVFLHLRQCVELDLRSAGPNA